MSETKTLYRVKKKGWFGSNNTADSLVTPVVVERANDKSVWINGRRSARRSSYENYFDTFEEGRDFLVGNLRAAMDAADNRAAACFSHLAEACILLDLDIMDQETALDPFEDMFFLLSDHPTIFPQGCALLWGPDNSGYVTDMAQAGHYTREQIMENRLYYDNDECHPIPIREALAQGRNVIERSHAEVLAKAVDLDA